MYKTVRSLVIALFLTVSAVPMVKADRWGTNPRPQSPIDDSPSMDTMVATILFNLGIF